MFIVNIYMGWANMNIQHLIQLFLMDETLPV